MRSPLIFLDLIVAILAVDQTPVSQKSCNKEPVNGCNCQCSLYQDSHVSEAIKALETKLERLIAVVNKATSSQPTTQPGKRSVSYLTSISFKMQSS